MDALDSKDGLLSTESQALSAKLGRGRGAERTNQASNQIHTCAEVRQKLVTDSLLETVPEPGQDLCLQLR